MQSMLVSLPSIQGLYLETDELADNYHRDMNVFADDITIEDDMAVLVKYDNKATMTYHLTAYSVSRVSFSILQCLVTFGRHSRQSLLSYEEAKK